jgi:hypothetical protein
MDGLRVWNEVSFLVDMIVGNSYRLSRVKWTPFVKFQILSTINLITDSPLSTVG